MDFLGGLAFGVMGWASFWARFLSSRISAPCTAQRGLGPLLSLFSEAAPSQKVDTRDVLACMYGIENGINGFAGSDEDMRVEFGVVMPVVEDDAVQASAEGNKQSTVTNSNSNAAVQDTVPVHIRCYQPETSGLR
jgi:hypothetical protein